MTVQKRSIVMIVLLALTLASYGAARYFSSSLILYVVEQSLAQKAPIGTDWTLLHKRFHAFLSAAPDQKAEMNRLLQLSTYLEKVQAITPEELNTLIPVEKPGKQPAR
jgi:hypothetical protein